MSNPGFLRLLDTTVTVQRPEYSADGYGNRVATYTGGTEYAAYVEQTKASETTLDRDMQQSDCLLMLPSNAVIDGSCRVLHSGRTYEVVGPPWDYRTKRGLHHIEATIREIRG